MQSVIISCYNIIISCYNITISYYNIIISCCNIRISHYPITISYYHIIMSYCNIILSYHNIIVSCYQIILSYYNIKIGLFNFVPNCTPYLPACFSIYGHFIRNQMACFEKSGFYLAASYLAIWLLLFKQRRMQFKPIKYDSFVEWVAKNNDDRHKIHEIFLINCFVFVITLV